MNIAIFLAVVLSPMLAVAAAGAYLLWERRYQRRLEIFRAMMRMRRIWLSAEWSGSLNLVPVEFAGCEPVLEALDALHLRYADPEWQSPDLAKRRRAVLDTENAACDLLLRMGEALRIGLRASDLRARPVAPFGWTTDDVQQRQTRDMLVQVLSGARALRVEPAQTIGAMMAHPPHPQPHQAMPWFEPSRPNGAAPNGSAANGHAEVHDHAEAHDHAAE